MQDAEEDVAVREGEPCRQRDARRRPGHDGKAAQEGSRPETSAMRQNKPDADERQE